MHLFYIKEDEMTIENTKDIIEHVISFHKLLEDYYTSLVIDCPNQRLKMLFNYLIEHERKMQDGLNEFEIKASQQVMDSWFKFSTCSEQFNQIKANLNLSELTVRNVVELCNRLYDCVIDQFEFLAEKVEIEEVKDVFLNIARLERKEQLRISRNSQQLQDL
jgi:hypothetical protein